MLIFLPIFKVTTSFCFWYGNKNMSKKREGGWSGIGMATVGIHPNDFDLYPNKIPPGRVVQNCQYLKWFSRGRSKPNRQNLSEMRFQSDFSPFASCHLSPWLVPGLLLINFPLTSLSKSTKSFQICGAQSLPPPHTSLMSTHFSSQQHSNPWNVHIV